MSIWYASGFVALVMVAAGLPKIFVPRRILVRWMKWAASWSDASVRLLGVAEVLGAIGLVVPVATGVWPALTPIAAVSIALLMGAAVKTQRDLGEPIALPVIVGLTSCAIAAMRL